MEIEKYLDGIRYTLSNDNLQVNDEVFPIGKGRIKEDNSFIFSSFNFENYLSDFPNKPHIILDLKHSDYKPYEVRTDYGYSPKECYFKIIKKERKTVEWKDNGLFKYKVKNEWEEI